MESLSSGLPSRFLKSLWTDILCCDSNTTTHCISAQQTLHCNCACTKTKGAGELWSTLARGCGAEYFHGPSPSACTHTHISALVWWQQRWQPMTLSCLCRTPGFIVQLFFSQIISNTHPGFLTHPERLWYLHPWKDPKPDCRGPWASCCRWSCSTTRSQEIPAKLAYPTEVLPMQLPALTTCHYSRGAIWAAPPWGTDFFHPALKAD